MATTPSARGMTELGVSVRSGLSVVGLGALGAIAAAADFSGGNFGFGAAILLVVGAVMLALFWGVTTVAAVGAGIGAQKGVKYGRLASVVTAAGGAIAGAIAVLVLMVINGL